MTSDWFTVWYSVPGYMSGSTCGNYGMKWYPAIDSRRGTVYPVHVWFDMRWVWYEMVTSDWFAVGYRYPVHVWFDMWWAWCSWWVWYSGYWSMDMSVLLAWYLKALKLAIWYTLLYKALYNIFAQHMVFICTYKSFTTSCSFIALLKRYLLLQSNTECVNFLHVQGQSSEFKY